MLLYTRYIFQIFFKKTKMQSTCHIFNLPDIKDFKSGGKFFKIKHLTKSKPLPDELLEYIYPQEFKESIQDLKMKKKFNSRKYDRLKNYCLSLKRRALLEEKEMQLNQKKEIEKKLMEEYFTRQLEEKIKDYYNSYYKKLYQNCNCNKT